MLSARAYLFARAANAAPLKSTDKFNEAAQGTRPRAEAASRDASPDMTPTATVTASKTTTATTSEPVVIPVRSHRGAPREGQRHKDRRERRHGAKRPLEQRARDVHSPDAIPPAVAALLAVTSIPRPRSKNVTARRENPSRERLTVDAVLKHTRVTEKELSMSLKKTPLDVLLSPPEELDEDEAMGNEMGVESSYVSSRTISTESVPSLADGSVGDESLSCGSIMTPNSRGKRSLPRRRLQALSSPPGESALLHPLSALALDLDEVDSRMLKGQSSGDHAGSAIKSSSPPSKFTFKSNLTASLRALRQAARSISSIKTPMIIPDDFLTMSLISIDPQVPFTDERMPPKLEDIPTPALRRYLNPTTNAPIEAHVPSSLAQTTRATKCSASIQMQTYRVSKSPQTTSPSVISRRTNTSTPEEVFAEVAAGPVARQRDMRENSDFIRIAVMEMLMRRNGKLDEKMPGRAKWALPPRKPSNKVYEVGEGGVPVRWIGTTN